MTREQFSDFTEQFSDFTNNIIVPRVPLGLKILEIGWVEAPREAQSGLKVGSQFNFNRFDRNSSFAIKLLGRRVKRGSDNVGSKEAQRRLKGGSSKLKILEIGWGEARTDAQHGAF